MGCHATCFVLSRGNEKSAVQGHGTQAGFKSHAGAFCVCACVLARVYVCPSVVWVAKCDRHLAFVALT